MPREARTFIRVGVTPCLVYTRTTLGFPVECRNAAKIYIHARHQSDYSGCHPTRDAGCPRRGIARNVRLVWFEPTTAEPLVAAQRI